MRGLALAAVLALGLHTPAAAYFCSEPSAPYCATEWDEFEDQDEFDSCRWEMESYGSELEDYLSCMRDEMDAALEEYNDAVASFNDRADG